MGSFFSRPKVSRDSLLAYKNFLRLYRMQHREMLPNDAFLNAARLWGTFSQAQRMRYAQMNCAISDVVMAEPKPGTAKTARKGVKKDAARKRTTKRNVTGAIGDAEVDDSPTSNGFLNFVDFYQENHGQISKPVALRQAGRVWSDMTKDQRDIFRSET
ncbi:uncharacterized protein LOC108031228 [Drosophila biarmipes]|uniref:uncharacterized protein LOC108031228 n=1 Tax=Drosophila biarmipes TaxID=125945 RepID=UPI0007E8508E|nr:uncharacterized protein LOC108031228 [Drosophila biarmipes]